MRLLITDLDNTLYDWVTYFANAFRAMVNELSEILSVDVEELFDEFKGVHRRYGNSEQPFAIFELPSVRKKFGHLSRAEYLKVLGGPLSAFRAARNEHLRLYPSVRLTLSLLRGNGVRIVGHTEAIGVQAYSRLRTLGIIEHFCRIYALEGHLEPHPDPLRAANQRPPAGLIKIVPKHERKPNPDLLRDICRREQVPFEEAWYVGDSKTRDVAMARHAGVTAVWAKYGTDYDPDLWKIVVRVTHWSYDDVQREEKLETVFRHIEPDYTIESFSEILTLSGVTAIEPQLELATVSNDA
jgi:phosphoglycolate phosphatase-like HAD superfamily hydrolase